MDEELRAALNDLVNEFGIEDSVYNIRESVADGDDGGWFAANPDKSSWDHPKVQRFGECVEIIKRALE